MPKTNSEQRLERWNIVFSVEDSEWLDKLAAEILARSGAKVTRSEIIRAALSAMQELHRCAPRCPSRFIPLEQCASGSELAQMAVLAVRYATPPG